MSQPFHHGGGSVPFLQLHGLSSRNGSNIAGISSKSQVFLPVILRYYTNEVGVDAKIDKTFKKKSIEKTILLLAK